MTRPTPDAVGRGGTLALNCTMCHGAQGMSASDAPNLAGQYPEVVIKQLEDYKAGRRAELHHAGAGAEAFGPRHPRPRRVLRLPAEGAHGADHLRRARCRRWCAWATPLRNIAPCISCHGGIDQKLGAPWIEGMPKAYLVLQLTAFRGGTRHNDGEAQMRNVARAMTDAEIDEVATFYAGKASAGGAR